MYWPETVGRLGNMRPGQSSVSHFTPLIILPAHGYFILQFLLRIAISLWFVAQEKINSSFKKKGPIFHLEMSNIPFKSLTEARRRGFYGYETDLIWRLLTELWGVPTSDTATDKVPRLLNVLHSLEGPNLRSRVPGQDLFSCLQQIDKFFFKFWLKNHSSPMERNISIISVGNQIKIIRKTTLKPWKINLSQL